MMSECCLRHLADALLIRPWPAPELLKARPGLWSAVLQPEEKVRRGLAVEGGLVALFAGSQALCFVPLLPPLLHCVAVLPLVAWPGPPTLDPPCGLAGRGAGALRRRA